MTISGQSFPEAALVASMYEQLLADAGYEPTVKLVDSRDGYMPTFPDSIDVVPEYVGGIVNFLNSSENGDDAEPFEAGDGQELADDGADLLDAAGITLLDLSAATDTNAFFVTKEFSESEGVTTLSDLEGMSVTLAAAPDCEGRLDCEGGLVDQYGIDVTEVLPLGYASDQTYQSVLDGESELGETSTTDGTLEAQGLVVLEDDQQIQPAQNLVPGGRQRLPRRAPGRRRRAEPADGGAHHREPHRAQRPGGRRPGEARGRRPGLPAVRGSALSQISEERSATAT